MAQPVPESRPIRSGGTRVGIIALLKTVANSAPTLASATAVSSGAMMVGSPGLPIHSVQAASTSSVPNPAIHGFLRPEASAMAPSTGDISAIARPAAAIAKPHNDWPVAASGAMLVAK
ncbi:hypothetical protein ACVWXN_008586 [Bradyrhizobium sp. i1.4.4]